MSIDLTGVTWRKSSRSNGEGQCIEVAGLDNPIWVKSTRSNGQGECVEAATDGRTVAVRDSKNPTGPAIPFTADAWTAFTGLVKTGTLDA
jgi:uncharacterized protein DUF397